MRLIHGDCIEEMQKLIDEGIKVDLILTDPPYGTTDCKWDSIIPFEPMWDCINKLSYDTTPTLLFASQPFLTKLIYSNIKDFKFNFIWDKHIAANPFLTKYMPSKVHEEIAVFYKKQPYYNPQKVPQKYGENRTRNSKNAMELKKNNSELFKSVAEISSYYIDDGFRLPQSIISFFPSQMGECHNNNRVHPTQKPVALLKWLILNYTKENDLVLDFTMGSGSTGVACLETNRDFIGIELEEKYYNIAKERCREYQSRLM